MDKKGLIFILSGILIVILLMFGIWFFVLSPMEYDGGYFTVSLPHGSSVNMFDNDFTNFYNKDGDKIGHIGLLGVTSSEFSMIYEYLGVNSAFTNGFFSSFDILDNYSYYKTSFNGDTALLFTGVDEDGYSISYYTVNHNGNVYAIVVNDSTLGSEMFNNSLSFN